MKKSIILMLVVAILALVCAVSCKDLEEQAIGSWEHSETNPDTGAILTVTYTFSKDGVLVMKMASGTGSLEFDESYKPESVTKGTIIVKDGEYSETSTYSINGSTMTVTTNGVPLDFIKLLK